VNRREFIGKRVDAWKRFEVLLGRLDRASIRKLTPAEASEFSRLFRELSYDLSIVRSRDWGLALSEYLNDLVSRGHNAFYGAPPGNVAHFIRFLAIGFPRLFRANLGYFLTAAAAFFGPLGITWAIVQNDPNVARRIVPREQLEMMDAMYSDRDESDSLKSRRQSEDFGEERAAMAGFYTKHNVGIALDCYGRGILAMFGSLYTLIFNGIALGAVAGYVIAQGHSERFLSFVVSHGSFELTAIAVAGGAGLMLGDSLLRPGQRTRIESLRVRGIESVQIACGAAVMLMVAALIEAFWSPSSVPNELKYAIGALLWVLVFVYLATAGRQEDRA
jgi:uncharacterized membrane protein SpoIIM required for sporulation